MRRFIRLLVVVPLVVLVMPGVARAIQPNVLYAVAARWAECDLRAFGRLFAGEGDGVQQDFAKCRTVYHRDWTSRTSEPRWVDAGDGTVTDQLTGLQWERKTTDGSIHDVSRTFTWSTGFGPADGTVFTELLRTLDDGCFAGHCDWRLPTRAELETVVAPGPYPCAAPCIDSAFGATTPIGIYWSATSNVTGEAFAWGVTFSGGGVGVAPKVLALPARAVRGGF